MAQLHSPRVLHVATHGFFLADAPQAADAGDERSWQLQGGGLSRPRPALPENPLLRSGLALAGANTVAPGSTDGILTALEVSALDLRGTSLVTLSACETGLGDVQNGEGVYGLRRAFFLAGTATQVMSLWRVDDVATQALMSGYYERLKRGEARSEALRAADLGMLS